MFNQEFYDLRTAVLMHQDALRTILAEHGVDASNLTVYEMVPLLRHIGVDLSFITATAADIKKGKLSVDSAGNKITGTLDLDVITATAADILEGKVSVDKDGNKLTGTLVPETGIDVSDTTATASDVKDGKKFYNADGVLTTGTNTDVNVSDTTANAPDVLNGKKFYNSAGVLTTGTLVPQSGDGGSTDFYKCAAVGEADSGSTTDLPEPVFYAPLTEQKSTAETGQALTYNGNVQFTEVDGVKCAYFQRGGIYSTSGLDIFNGLTVATKVRLTSTSDSNTYFYFGDTEMNSLGLWSSGGSFELGSVGKASGGTIFAFSHNIQANVYYDFAVVYDGSELAFYIDGVLVYSGAWAYDVSTAFIGIGCYKANGNIFSYSSNYQTGFRVFNQAMTAEQVKKLYDPNYEPLAPLTWNGYKAVLVNTDDGKAYYEFSETLTKGLTYGKGFTPVVDKVYDAEAMVRAELHTARIITCPVNMTATENEEWVISASASFAEHVFLRAFDGSIGSIWAGTGGSDWIQWQNKNEPVLVKQLEISYENHHSDHVTDLLLQGSNDGQSWTTIGETSALSWEVSGEYDATAKVTFPANTTKYFYHRLTCNRESSYRALIGTLITKSVID